MLNSKKWVLAYRHDLLNIKINTTNGVERTHKELKRNYLNKFGPCKTLLSNVTIITTKFLPALEKKYIQANVMSRGDVKAYSSDIPQYLKNKPRKLIAHCKKRIVPISSVTVEYTRANQTYNVKWHSTDIVHHVQVYKDVPSCTCKDWKLNKWPCVHLLMLFQTNSVAWTDSELYTQQTCFLIDDFTPLNQSDANTKEHVINLCDEESQSQDMTINVNMESKECLEIVKNIEPGLHCVDNADVIINAKGMLKQIDMLLDNSKVQLHNLPLNSTKKKLKLKKLQLCHYQNILIFQW